MRAGPMALVLVAAGCGGGGAADSGVDATIAIDAGALDAGALDAGALDAGPSDAGPALALVHDFPEHTIGSGVEVLGLCTSWTLGNESELFVNTVDIEQSESLLSSMWFFVPQTAFDGADGDWSCGDRGFSMPSAIAAGGGVLFRQSVGASSDTQAFGDGVAIRVPPHARIIGVLQAMNLGAASVTGHTTLTVHTIPSATALLQAVLLVYDGLRIPAMASSRFSAVCTLALDRIHYLQPNARSLATRVFASIEGGPRTGEALLDVSPFVIGASPGITFSPASDLSEATGLRFGCEYTNPRPILVRWGFGDQEQCDVLAFVEAPSGASASVSQANPMGTSGSQMLFDGPCTVTTF